MAINLPALNEKHGAIGTMGLIFITHGAARIYFGSVGDFGGFLDSQGLMIGLAIAWIITIGEIISGALLIFGLLVKYLVVFHGLIILSGIFLVHLHNGWFTLGHGQGGVEYSVLILAVLVYLYSREGSKII
jgi:putative oxidoreductase